MDSLDFILRRYPEKFLGINRYSIPQTIEESPRSPLRFYHYRPGNFIVPSLLFPVPQHP